MHKFVNDYNYIDIIYTVDNYNYTESFVWI